MDKQMYAADQISLFCRININTKKALPIRSSEMGLLIYLVKTKQVKTPMAIADFFKVSKAMVTNMMASLTKKGYIIKQRSTKDGRSVYLMPTHLAIDLVEETYEEYYKNLMLLEKNMGEEKFGHFIELLKQANEILLEERKDG